MPNAEIIEVMFKFSYSAQSCNAAKQTTNGKDATGEYVLCGTHSISTVGYLDFHCDNGRRGKESPKVNYFQSLHLILENFISLNKCVTRKSKFKLQLG